MFIVLFATILPFILCAVLWGILRKERGRLDLLKEYSEKQRREIEMMKREYARVAAFNLLYTQKIYIERKQLQKCLHQSEIYLTDTEFQDVCEYLETEGIVTTMRIDGTVNRRPQTLYGININKFEPQRLN